MSRVCVNDGVHNKFVSDIEVSNYLMQGWQKGRCGAPWNKGLTKEDPRVLQYAEGNRRTRNQWTEEQKRTYSTKVSQALKGRKLSEETLNKRKQTLKEHPILWTEERKRYISQKFSGRKMPPEVGRKISAATKGKKMPPCSEERKQQLSRERSSPEWQAKHNAVKRARGTFHVSHPEKLWKERLGNKFGVNNVIYNYRSDLYPFNCDFYIKSMNLYIELNFHWTHGSHPYNADNYEDQLLLEKWKSKHTKFYEAAICTWTVRDVRKRQIAQENQLNYRVFYNEREIENWFNTY